VVLPNPVFDYYSKLLGSSLIEQNLKKIHISERSNLLSNLNSRIGSIYYNVISRKNRSKNHIEKLFQKQKQDIINPQEKSEIKLRKLRTYRLTLCQDFCYDVLTEVYGDALKL
jgi:hypothetical protein